MARLLIETNKLPDGKTCMNQDFEGNYFEFVIMLAQMIVNYARSNKIPYQVLLMTIKDVCGDRIIQEIMKQGSSESK